MVVKPKTRFSENQESALFDRFMTKLASLENAKQTTLSTGTLESDENLWNLWKRVLSYKNVDNIVDNIVAK